MAPLPLSFGQSKDIVGREDVHSQILAAYDRVQEGGSEAIFVSGPIGIGKSVLLQTIRRNLTRLGAFCAIGVFDPTQPRRPLAVISTLLVDIVQQILAAPAPQYEQWRRRLRDSVGGGIGLLTELVPAARLLFDPQSTPRLSPLADQRQRLILLLRNINRALATPTTPVIWCWDDCQWSDPLSAELLRQLMLDPAIQHWLFVGAARSGNALDSPGAVELALAGARSAGATVHWIGLSPLSPEDTAKLISSVLATPAADLAELAFLIHRQAAGNPLYIRQAIEQLQSTGQLTQAQNSGHWHWSPTAIAQLPINGIAQLVRQRLASADPGLQEILAQASCIGSTFTAELLAYLSGEALSTINERLEQAAALGFLSSDPRVAGAWTFAHDEVRQAAQTILSATAVRDLRQRMGAYLLSEGREASAEQLRIAILALNERLINPLTVNTAGLPLALAMGVAVQRLAAVNRVVSQQAIELTDVAGALDFARAGLSWLALLGDPWQVDGDLALALSTLLLRATQLSGDYVAVQMLGDGILPRVADPVKKARLYQILILAATAHGDYARVSQLQHEGLRALGINFPRRPGWLHLLWHYARCRILLSKIADEQLLALASAPDPRWTAAGWVMMSTFLASQWQGNQIAVLLGALLGVQWTLDHGYVSLSVIGFAIYSVMLMQMGARLVEVKRYTRLTLAILDRLPDHRSRAATLLVLNTLVLHRLDPLRDLLPSMRATIEMALRDGDGQFAADCALAYLSTLQIAGTTLTAVLAEGEPLVEHLATFGESIGLRLCRFMLSSWQKLASQIDTIWDTTTEEVALLADLDREGHTAGLSMVHSVLLFRRLAASDLPAAQESAQRVRQLFKRMTPGLIAEPLFYQLDSLAQLLHLSQDRRIRSRQLRQVTINQRRLQLWVEQAPFTHQHRWFMVEAQRASSIGEDAKASQAFDRAWTLASQGGFLGDAAGAAELAARHHLARGDFARAQADLQRAKDAYHAWGSEAKVRVLARTLPLTAPPGHADPDPSQATFAAFTARPVRLAEHLHELTQATSIEQILQRSGVCVQQQTGAHRCLLLAGYESSHLAALFCADSEGVQIWSKGAPLAVDIRWVPLPAMRYVLRTRQPLIVEEDEQGYWCLPLFVRSRVAGLLYVENPRVADPVQAQNHATAIATTALLLWENEQLHAGHVSENIVPTREVNVSPAQSAGFRAQLLGRRSFVYNGQEITSLLNERMQALLALLLLRRHEAYARSQLAQDLWPEATADQGRTNLRNLLFKLRSAWPDCAEVLEFGRHEIRWHAAVTIAIDSEAFQAAVAASADNHGLAAQRMLEHAFSLYQGELLPGLNQDLILAQREHMQDQYLAILDRLIHLHMEHEEYAMALTYAQRTVQTAPARERNYHHLIRLYALLGDAASARRAYDACVAMLRQEFDAPPSPRTIEIFTQFVG